MSLLSSVADGPVLDALASALLHFVWQGAVLALLLALWFRRVGSRSNARYVAGVVTLAAMLAAPVATFTWIATRQGVRSIDVAPEARTTPAPVVGATDTTLREVEPEPVTPTAASALLGRIAPAAEAGMLVIWFAGVAALSLRLLGGWVVARRLATQAVRPASADLRTLATQIAGRLALDRAVSVLESSRVRVPVIVGWLKPVVLFPAATLSSLSPSQIEAILAHELAHIRRHDYLVNLLQSARRNAAVLSPGGLVGVASCEGRARALLRRRGGGGVRSSRLRQCAFRSGEDDHGARDGACRYRWFARAARATAPRR